VTPVSMTEVFPDDTPSASVDCTVVFGRAWWLRFQRKRRTCTGKMVRTYE